MATTRYVILYGASGSALASLTLPTLADVTALKQQFAEVANGSAASVLWSAPVQSASGQSVERTINLSMVGQLVVQTVTQ